MNKQLYKIFVALSCMLTASSIFFLMRTHYAHDLLYAQVKQQDEAQLLHELSHSSTGQASGTVRVPSANYPGDRKTATVMQSSTRDAPTISHGNVRVSEADNLHSNMPPFKSWSKGVVTEIIPTLKHNYSKLMQGDSDELHKTTLLLSKHHFQVNASFSDCDKIKTDFSDNFYVSESEKCFPIAFVLVVHTNAQQILRFLKAIYRPHNHYCIHPDPASGLNDFMNKFKLLSHCLPNVIIPSHLWEVNYDSPSTIFRAQMSCFRELSEAKLRLDWRYVINLCGRELPLKTNRHIVETLRKMNGKSVLEPYPYLIDKYTLETRFSSVIARVSENRNCTGHNQSEKEYIKSVERCDDFLQQNNLKLYKSLTYNAYARPFVNHFLHDQVMQNFLGWILENCQTPEEHFYAMAAMKPGTPGGAPLKSTNTTVFKAIWYHPKSSPHWLPGEKCAGKVVHQICILNAAELPRIHEAMTNDIWFFNKYVMEDDHVVMDCVEEELIRSNKLEFAQDHGH